MLVRYFLYLLSSRKKVEFQSRIDGLKQYMELRSVENKLQGLCLTKSGSFLIQFSESGAKINSSILNLEQNLLLDQKASHVVSFG